MPDVSLNTIEIQLEASSTSAASKIDKLADSLNKLSSVGGIISQLSGLADAINAIGSAAGGHISSIQALRNALRDLNATQGASRRIENLAQAVQSLGTASSTAVNPFSGLVQQMQTMSGIQLSASINNLTFGLTQLSAMLGNITTAMETYIDVLEQAREASEDGIPNPMAQGGVDTDQATARMSDLAVWLRKVEQNAWKAVVALAKVVSLPARLTLGKAFQSIAGSIKDTTKKAVELFAGLKRIALYRILRTALKEIGKAFKEGLENAYYFSKGINGDLAIALDQLAVKSQTMRNQLGSAFGGLLQTIMPIIQQIIAWITALASAISALFSMFGGRGTYLKAVDASAEFAKNTKSGAGSAKRMKDYLMGIDELNVIKEPTDSGGGGGGANALDYASMFKEEDLPDWMKNIRELLDMGEFYKAGSALADYLNDLMPSEEQFRKWGQDLGTKINNAIEFALGFVDTMNWEQIGKNFGEYFNGVIEKIDPWELGRLLTAKFEIALEVINGFLQRYDAEATGKWLEQMLMGAIAEIDFALLGETLRLGVESILETVNTFLMNLSFVPIYEKFGQFLAEFFNGTDEFKKNILTAFQDLGLAMDAIKTAIGELTGMFADMLFGKEHEGEKSTYEIILENLSVVIKNVAGEVKKLAEDFKKWVETSEALQKFIKSIENLGIAVSAVLRDFSELLKGINIDFPSALDMLVTGFGQIADVVTIASSLIGSFILDLQNMQLMLDWLSKDVTFDEMTAKLKENYAAQDEYMALAGEAAKNYISTLGESLEQHGILIPGIIGTIFNNAGASAEKSGKETGTKFYNSVKPELDRVGLEITGMSNTYEDFQKKTSEFTKLTSDTARQSYEEAVEKYNEAQKASEELKKASTETQEQIKQGIEAAILDAGQSFTEGIKEIENQLAMTVISITNGAQQMVNSLNTTVGGFYTGFLATLATTTQSTLLAFSMITTAFDNMLAGKITPDLTTFFGKTTTDTTELSNHITTAMDTLATNLETVLDTRVSPKLTAFYNNLIDGMWDLYWELVGRIGAVDETIAKVADNIELNVVTMIENIWAEYDLASAEISEDFEDMIDTGKTEFRRMTDNFKINMMEAAGTARQEISAVREALNELNGYTVHVYIRVHTIGDNVGAAMDKIKGALGKFGFKNGGIIKAANGLSNLNQGQMFIAREAGPELIGSIGHGQTAVMNNNQIVSSVSAGVADGVYAAMADVMASQGSGDNTRPVILVCDGRELARAVEQGRRQSGYQLSSNPTFA